MEKTNIKTNLIKVTKLQDFTYEIEKLEKCYELTILLNKDDCLAIKIKNMIFIPSKPVSLQPLCH